MSSTKASPSSSVVNHDTIRKFFYIQLEGVKEVTHLDYKLIGSDVIDFTHTFNPKIPEAKGKAKEIVVYGLNYAKSNNLKVIPSCWYVEKVIYDNLDEFKDLLYKSKL
ncbi:hypothetical protein CONCODRAFT_14875 [Conidiobolus coronatus NRRL 28638]|uniref:N-acetyltransferase domain-containing protein n=1 Tax=Conidiobolus coronatus (strain ATCC 28846 / CBS 209.66 / NRRL 28638) TaxID=796925 RepID=A0A137PHH7_CONC2|nr:hypothetical protein CONCODRAFT_14875 [Conidiobolus coronatus NRRL 28638]|eukprot:KXN74391.1 hypothetical protein CONCODRAFT_14875 [Conidiobolus coronatus NRRL 28638]